jgi:hypothetical protein
MSILLFAIVVVIILALLIYAVDLIPLTQPFNGVLKALVILIGVLLICQRAGLL